MANHLDFLFALDQYTRESASGSVSPAAEMHEIAKRAGFVEHGDTSAARWTGELVELGYLRHGPAMGGTTRPVPPRGPWSNADLQVFSDYRVTPEGREEADRMRRLHRESATDAAMGLQLPWLKYSWMSEQQARAISEPLLALRTGLDGDHSRAAIGAAKDLVEAACKVVIERAGEAASNNASLITLFKQAHRLVMSEDQIDTALGRSLTASVQRLAEMRNVSGAGHGHSSPPAVGNREVVLAASAASAIAAYLLSAELA